MFGNYSIILTTTKYQNTPECEVISTLDSIQSSVESGFNERLPSPRILSPWYKQTWRVKGNVYVYIYMYMYVQCTCTWLALKCRTLGAMSSCHCGRPCLKTWPKQLTTNYQLAGVESHILNQSLTQPDKQVNLNWAYYTNTYVKSHVSVIACSKQLIRSTIHIF